MTTATSRTAGENLDADLVLGLHRDGLLGQFNRAGVLVAADIHVAAALGRLAGDDDELVALAVALAVRAPRVGHVLVDLATIRQTAVAGPEDEADLSELPWPAPGTWVGRVKRSPLVAPDDDAVGDQPLRLAGSCLYLDRYWQDERDVALNLTVRARQSANEVDELLLAAGLTRFYPEDGPDLQRRAAATVLQRLLTVIAGGPGTGKTTTIARVLALVAEQALQRGQPFPLVALAAPTGKAAARMAEAVHHEARRLDLDEAVRAWLLSLEASTVHRLLGRRPGTATRFRHDANNRLPYDVVIVDETSMMSLSLMARLLDAVRDDARLVLVGDQEQLASVEAGAVLGDIVGPAAGAVGLDLGDLGLDWTGPGSAMPIPGSAGASSARHGPAGAGAAGPTPGKPSPGQPSPIARCITVLQANYRFRGPLAELAGAIRTGDADAVMAVLWAGRSAEASAGLEAGRRAGLGEAGAGGARPAGTAAGEAGLSGAGPGEARSGEIGLSGAGDVMWLDIDLGVAPPASLEPVRWAVLQAQQPLLEAAREGDGAAALDALGRLRLLCAHREGPAGAVTWNSRGEQWLADVGEGPPLEGGWYLGRPVIVTENDYGLGLFNGDMGVVIAEEDGGLRVAFRRGAGVVTVSPARLGAVGTAFAMTVHRAQGSEFEDVVVLLPGASSRVLTRELLYTAVTRARRGALLVGTEESVRAAVGRPIARASGLTARLWGTSA